MVFLAAQYCRVLTGMPSSAESWLVVRSFLATFSMIADSIALPFV
jgi:hypothetical protein